MDLSVARTQVRYILGETTADFWTDAELNLYLLEAQHRFLGEANWPWLITSTTVAFSAGVATKAVGEGIEAQNIIAVNLAVNGDTRTYTPTRVSPVKGFELGTLYNTTTTAANPLYWYVSAVADADNDNLYIQTFTLVPAPTSAITMNVLYLRDAAAAFTSDTDEPDLPLEYHKALVHYAAGTAWLKELNGAPKAQEQFDLYNKVVEQAKNEWFGQVESDPLVMGKDEPQYGVRRPPADYWLLRMPETLGP